MKTLEYFQFRAHYYTQEQKRQITLRQPELEELWNCTRKSVQRKLKQLMDDKLLRYEPGRGRGNPSTIRFAQSFKDEINRFVQQCIKEETLEPIIQLLHLPIPERWVTDVTAGMAPLFGKTETPASRDVLRTIMARPMTALDPLYSSIAFEVFLLVQLGDTLTLFDSETNSVVPHLAHHWRSEENDSVWTIYLRKSVRFHNLQVMTAKDVRFSLKRFLDRQSPHDWLLEDVAKIECVSDFCLKITLKQSNPHFMRYLSFENLVILPESEEFDENRWIASGPFRLKKRSANRIVLSAHDHYFLERPFLDQIEIYSISPEKEQSMLFQLEGQQDHVEPKNRKDIETGVRFLCFNMNKGASAASGTQQGAIVHNPHFREAIYHIFDVEEMASEIEMDQMLPAATFHPRNRRPIRKDPKKIPYLLQKSGYKGETLVLTTLGFPKQRRETGWFLERAKSYGINMTVELFSLGDLYDTDIEKRTDLFLLGEISSADYLLSFISIFKSRSLTCARFFSPEDLAVINQLLSELKVRSSTQVEQDQIIEKVEEYIRSNHLMVFLYHPIKKKAFHPMIKDIQLNSFGMVDFRKLWIE